GGTSQRAPVDAESWYDPPVGIIFPQPFSRPILALVEKPPTVAVAPAPEQVEWTFVLVDDHPLGARGPHHARNFSLLMLGSVRIRRRFRPLGRLSAHLGQRDGFAGHGKKFCAGKAREHVRLLADDAP